MKRFKKLKTWKKVVIILMLLVIVAGICVSLWPVVHGWWLNQQSEDIVEEFVTTIDPSFDPKTLDPSEPFILDREEEEEDFPYADLYAAMQEYNETIYKERQIELKDAWSYTNPAFVLEDYGIEGGCFGVISIPSLSVLMPLYLGCTYTHLADGFAQLTETSIPIGGENTNAVIAGHCGWGGADYLRYLCNIEIGDYVYVTNLWETLAYQVVDTEIIDPDEIDKVLIQNGKDMITLFTCHPYASGGKYRFCVFCERVDLDSIPEVALNTSKTTK